jgi:heat shock protein HslJ
MALKRGRKETTATPGPHLADILRAPLLALLVFACYACASPALGPPALRTAGAASARGLPPSVEELKNMAYAGIDERLGPVTLENGRWTGEPIAVGAASRPVVELAGDFRLVGDLDGDGLEEAVVVLTYRPGGTGALSFLAVVTRENGTLRNVATTGLGDRVQIRLARIEDKRLIVSAVRAGEHDAACCPGELVESQWTLGDGRLNALGSARTGRLSLATLSGTVWVLRAWDIPEPAGSEPVVTLAYDAGHFAGTSGCNRYVAGVTAGDVPGQVSVGPLAGTRMACPEPQSTVESRFLEQLGGARTFGFMLGRLAISYARGDGSRGTMLFDVRTPSKGP